MTIVSIAKILAAVERAEQLQPDRETAIAAAAQSLRLPEELVREALARAQELAAC